MTKFNNSKHYLKESEKMADLLEQILTMFLHTILNTFRCIENKRYLFHAFMGENFK